MLDRLQSQTPRVLWTAERDTITGDAMPNGTGRGVFATPRCPISKDVFALARYLMRNAADAE